MSPLWVDLTYLAAAVLFVLALKGLSHPRRAVRGNLLGSIAMLVAVGVTLFDQRIVRGELILAGLVLGGGTGLALALRVPLTAMPELVALFNGLGGGASALVAGSAVVASTGGPVLLSAGSVSCLVGSVTFSGSLVAVAKLRDWTPPGLRAPVLLERVVLGALLAGSLVSGVSLVMEPRVVGWYLLLAGLAAALGIALVLPVGGADMPVVIALLNACSGLAAAATGFALMNQALVISGSLVGASGLILTRIMCRAMNRSLQSVLFVPPASTAEPATGGGRDRPVKSVSPEEVAMMLEAARKVVVVPGYGMAVAQAQHALAELAKRLEARGISILFGIHPVAGRMPGHMNVLLAEADVSYEMLRDLDACNPELPETDVALVVGANDVVNPQARTDRASPLFGMPIVDVDRARAVVIMKRGLGAGYAGVDNPLFTADNAVMLFGDARKSVRALIDALSEASS